MQHHTCLTFSSELQACAKCMLSTFTSLDYQLKETETEVATEHCTIRYNCVNRSRHTVACQQPRKLHGG